MSLQDLVSDFVARINNGIISEKKEVEVLKNKLVLNLCKKMTTLGYFESFEEAEGTVAVVLNLKKLSKIKRMSKPGRRIYKGFDDATKIVGGKGYNLITTSKGVLTQVEAKEQKAGGELVLQVF
jgi:small subunit ribosomal protein S8